MSGNLVIISDNKIVFSNHFRKPNGIPIIIPITTMIDVVDARFSVPISSIGLSCLAGSGLNTVDLKTPIDDGPVNVYVCKNKKTQSNSAIEVCISKARKNNIPLVCTGYSEGDKSLYVRSDEHSLESAACAAGIIYDNPITAYVEAHKATGYNLYPFYIGSINLICEALSKANEIEKEFIKIDTNKNMTEEEKEKAFVVLRDRAIKQFSDPVDFLQLVEVTI
jgi:hypothetical protein